MIYVTERLGRMGSLYSVSELRGSIYVIVQPDFLYALYILTLSLAHYDVTLYWHGRLKSPKLCDVDYVDICVTWRLPYSNETNKILLFY